jgi:hypothetical protein
MCLSISQCREDQVKFERDCQLLFDWDLGDFGCDEPFLARATWAIRNSLPTSPAAAAAAPITTSTHTDATVGKEPPSLLRAHSAVAKKSMVRPIPAAVGFSCAGLCLVLS